MIKANILNVKYNNVEVKINLTDGNAIQLNIQTESQLLPPSNKDDNTGLFKIRATIQDQDSKELYICAEANIIFEFDQIPTDYNETGRSVCLKQSQKLIFEKIGDIMETMGYNCGGHIFKCRVTFLDRWSHCIKYAVQRH